MRFLYFVTALVALASGAAIASGLSAQAARPPVLDVARAVQKNYDAVRDFSADFVHSYVGGVLGQRVTERGTVVIKKPGKMRWNYTSPEKKVFVSDGVKLYSYVPADKQVTINAVPAGDDTSTPTLFLAGKGNITRDFTVGYTEVPGAPADTYAIKLVPTRREQDYDWLVLVVDQRTYRIRMLVTTDTQGGTSTFTFTNMKENVNVPDQEFAFKIPRGVEVVDNSR